MRKIGEIGNSGQKGTIMAIEEKYSRSGKWKK